MSGSALQPGDRVQIRDAWPEADGPAHVRTPHYVRGRHGTVLRALGAFPDPGDLAFARPAPPRALYHVLVDLETIWPGSRTRDSVLIELYGHWLEKVTAP